MVQPVFTAVMMGDANGVLLGEAVRTNVLERNYTCRSLIQMMATAEAGRQLTPRPSCGRHTHA